MPSRRPFVALLVCLSPADDAVLSRFTEARQAFDAAVLGHRQKAVKGYDRLIDTVGKTAAAVLPAGERDKLSSDLREARDEFARTGKVKSVGLLLADTHVTYLTALRTEAGKLTGAADRLSGPLKPADPRAADMRKQAAEARGTLAKYDTFQPGSKWDGYRSDFASPAVLKTAVNPINLNVRLRIRQPGAVGIDWHLTVSERKGDQFKGVVAQDGGAAKWTVVGEFDGVNLTMTNANLPNYGMLKGKARAFVYAGQLAGGVGVLEQDGYKTNGKQGKGIITIELRP